MSGNAHSLSEKKCTCVLPSPSEQYVVMSSKRVQTGAAELLGAICQRWLKNAGFLYICELAGELKTSLILPI